MKFSSYLMEEKELIDNITSILLEGSGEGRILIVYHHGPGMKLFMDELAEYLRYFVPTDSIEYHKADGMIKAGGYRFDTVRFGDMLRASGYRATHVLVTRAVEKLKYNLAQLDILELKAQLNR